MKYKVLVERRIRETWLVDADSEEEAEEKVSDGEGEYQWASTKSTEMSAEPVNE